MADIKISDGAVLSAVGSGFLFVLGWLKRLEGRLPGMTGEQKKGIQKALDEIKDMIRAQNADIATRHVQNDGKFTNVAVRLAVIETRMGNQAGVTSPGQLP